MTIRSVFLAIGTKIKINQIICAIFIKKVSGGVFMEHKNVF